MLTCFWQPLPFPPAKSQFRQKKKPKQQKIITKTLTKNLNLYIKGGFTITNEITNKDSEYSVL